MTQAQPARRTRRRRCPRCGQLGALPVIYGLPDITAMDLAAEGKLILGGCMLGSDDPDWLCLPCAKGPDPQTD